MVQINPYLTFNGNCEDAFNFYRSVFGGDFAFVGRFSEMPSEQPLPASEANKIMHISLPLSGGSVLMGSDTSDSHGLTTMGTNFSISINAASKNDADTVFNALSSGGQVTMPMSNTFWGSYFGMLTDKFGIQWMMSFAEQEQK